MSQEEAKVKKETAKEHTNSITHAIQPNTGNKKQKGKKERKEKNTGGKKKSPREEGKKQRKGLQSRGLEDSDSGDDHKVVVKEEPKQKKQAQQKKKKIEVFEDDDDREEDDDDDEDEQERSEVAHSTSSESSEEHSAGEEERYEVMEIVGARVKGDVPVQEFKVKWKGGKCTWETEDRLEGCGYIIEAWRAGCKRKNKAEAEAQKQKMERIKPNQSQQDEYSKLIAAFKKQQGKDPGNAETARMWDKAAISAAQTLPSKRARQ